MTEKRRFRKAGDVAGLKLLGARLMNEAATVAERYPTSAETVELCRGVWEIGNYLQLMTEHTPKFYVGVIAQLELPNFDDTDIRYSEEYGA